MSIIWKCFIAFILFVIAYVAMAWYDYKFECTKLALKRGSRGGLTTKLKPPPHKESQTDPSKDTKEEKDLTMSLINVYHLFILVPVLLYIGLTKSTQAEIILIANLGFAFLYHIVRLLRRFNGVSLGHVLVSILGILYLIIKQGKNKPLWFYYLLIFVALYTGLKHGYELMVSSHSLHTDVEITI